MNVRALLVTSVLTSMVLSPLRAAAGEQMPAVFTAAEHARQVQEAREILERRDSAATVGWTGAGTAYTGFLVILGAAAATSGVGLVAGAVIVGAGMIVEWYGDHRFERTNREEDHLRARIREAHGSSADGYWDGLEDAELVFLEARGIDVLRHARTNGGLVVHPGPTEPPPGAGMSRD